MFQKFSKIYGLHNIVKNHRSGKKFNPEMPDVVQYQAKIKLHGTNAGVIVSPDGVFAQKRSAIITPENDNFGFASWVHQNRDVFSRLTEENTILTIYGEWVGPGIQKNVACSMFPEKQFFVFAIDVRISENGNKFRLYEPTSIEAMMVDILHDVENMHVIPWYNQKIELDFSNGKQLNFFVENANKEVEKIDECDPFILDEFGMEGHGEGLVYYPRAFIHPDKREQALHEFGKSFSDYAFKVKGESHAVNKQGKPARVENPLPDSFYEFVECVVTPARMEQAIQETGAEGKEDTGKLIGWVCKDIAEEEKDTLEEMGVTTKKMGGPIAAKVRKMWFEKLEEL